MRNAGLDELQAGIKISRRNINNLRYADDTTPMAENKEIPDEGEGGEWKSQLRTINKTKITALGPIISWQTEGEKVEAVTGFLFLGSKITVDGDCSCEIRRRLFLGRKAMTNLDSVLKSRDYYSADKGSYSQGHGLPSGHVRLWELDQKGSRMLKNWCLWTVLLEKTPESPLESKEIKPVSLKGNQPWTLTGRTDAPF